KVLLVVPFEIGMLLSWQVELHGVGLSGLRSNAGDSRSGRVAGDAPYGHAAPSRVMAERSKLLNPKWSGAYIKVYYGD
ncbi:MAG TPA: hypothetical protein VJB12_01395, partial [Candidatus Nanoarchaeia archaeon]|nr:hypothetical protein [Candidatus Nanoarchaeia archaeon]